ncbi:hypothetical protein C8R32_11622 [Nitrosospira sp. Nsp5]|nr:hypothetical protein C8R32_11622 [Nitrosospira sp. Nsp5]
MTRLSPRLWLGLPITKIADGIGKLRWTRISENSILSSKKDWLNTGRDKRLRFRCLEAFHINLFLALLSTIVYSDS